MKHVLLEPGEKFPSSDLEQIVDYLDNDRRTVCRGGDNGAMQDWYEKCLRIKTFFGGIIISIYEETLGIGSSTSVGVLIPYFFEFQRRMIKRGLAKKLPALTGFKETTLTFDEAREYELNKVFYENDQLSADYSPRQKSCLCGLF
jgi:hypothetical protein